MRGERQIKAVNQMWRVISCKSPSESLSGVIGDKHEGHPPKERVGA